MAMRRSRSRARGIRHHVLAEAIDERAHQKHDHQADDEDVEETRIPEARIQDALHDWGTPAQRGRDDQPARPRTAGSIGTRDEAQEPPYIERVGRFPGWSPRGPMNITCPPPDLPIIITRP